ncbi:MAG: thioredoxin [Candidatus Peribacteraceae bacterium]|nr:thioredoxin [Candidatus Peribacteraceae bacterium]
MANPITDATFDAEVLKADMPVFIDFWAPWCGPCKAMLPIVEELGEKYKGKVKIVKMNVDDNTEVPGKYNIMSIPTFLLIKKGEVVDSFVGARSKEELSIKLDAAIAA